MVLLGIKAQFFSFSPVDCHVAKFLSFSVDGDVEGEASEDGESDLGYLFGTKIDSSSARHVTVTDSQRKYSSVISRLLLANGLPQW